MTSRGCKYSPDQFCYIYGEYIKKRANKFSVTASSKMCKAYKAYFGMSAGDQGKNWAPPFTCAYCKKTLEGKKAEICKHHKDKNFFCNIKWSVIKDIFCLLL